jgi:hypothetical protein
MMGNLAYNSPPASEASVGLLQDILLQRYWLNNQDLVDRVIEVTADPSQSNVSTLIDDIKGQCSWVKGIEKQKIRDFLSKINDPPELEPEPEPEPKPKPKAKRSYAEKRVTQGYVLAKMEDGWVIAKKDDDGSKKKYIMKVPVDD